MESDEADQLVDEHPSAKQVDVISTFWDNLVYLTCPSLQNNMYRRFCVVSMRISQVSSGVSNGKTHLCLGNRIKLWMYPGVSRGILLSHLHRAGFRISLVACRP